MKITPAEFVQLITEARVAPLASGLVHDCRESEATIDKQGRHVIELEARAQQAEARLKSTCHHYAEARRELERVQGERDALEAQIDKLRNGRVNGVSHALLNELSLLSDLPGSPEYADCIRRFIEELPGLRVDAALGRQVRAMQRYDEIRLCRLGFKATHAGFTSDCYPDPEDALRAAGVTGEPRAGDDGAGEAGGGGGVEEEQAEREGVRS